MTHLKVTKLYCSDLRGAPTMFN